MKNDLIILGRYPREGLVKTRLGHNIGYRQAAKFYEVCLEYLISEIEKLKGVSSYFYYADKKDKSQVNRWLKDKKITPVTPSTTDVNKHLSDAFAQRFSKGAKKVISVGSDIPDVSAELITKAFGFLDKYDLVIGPDHGGGIYLFGCKKVYPELFSGDYSNGVWEGTFSQIKKLGVSYKTLPVLIDVDTLQDLKEWQKNGLNRTHPAKQFNQGPSV